MSLPAILLAIALIVMTVRLVMAHLAAALPDDADSAQGAPDADAAEPTYW